MRVEKSFAYPLFTLPIAIYLIGFFGVYIYRGFDNSMFSQEHQFAIVGSLIITFRAIIWYSSNGGFKKYILDISATWIGLAVLAGILFFIQWVFSLF